MSRRILEKKIIKSTITNMFYKSVVSEFIVSRYFLFHQPFPIVTKILNLDPNKKYDQVLEFLKPINGSLGVFKSSRMFCFRSKRNLRISSAAERILKFPVVLKN